MYSNKNVVERLGNARHEYGAVRFLLSGISQAAITPFRFPFPFSVFRLFIFIPFLPRRDSGVSAGEDEAFGKGGIETTMGGL